MKDIRKWAADNACQLIFMSVLSILTWIWILVVNKLI